uniref:Response receiver domain-containing protein n=1 Tax=Candidatus Kentrum eta TaxID=2126337 RepID=A0A450UCW6_9GAMM|nr:MAG: hypothetical protein BECKH772A_GA0070896_1000733 [Candidatus Kentron sp. H]VFJ90213.1 MAG: hypothetical protein BECKH772B_GA0070898_1000833 [Candidatus Kentron sp. H]VFJ96572.1 MAG: hypothetical protein BECKH772C_GA0070978_1000733 [Candidatus Kentron sp. H]
MTEQLFQDVMSETAARFLQSVVVLDDQVICRPPAGTVNTSQALPELQKPGKGSAAKVDDQIPKPKKESDANGNGRHTFELFEVVHGFAARGVVCGTLNPLAENDDKVVKDGILKAGRRADIVILDWQIKGRDKQDDGGEMAMELIDKLVSADNETDMARRRLVVIYTGETLGPVVDRFDNKFKPEGFSDPLPAASNGDPCRQRGGFRVIFLLKHSVGFSELPQKAIEEFARMNTGLLGGAALHGLAAIRENTHRILSRFPAELDGAYLAHRAMTAPPQAAESHIGPLLASELEDVLAGARLEESLNLDAIKQRLKESGAGNAESIEKTLSEGTDKAPPEDISKNQLKKNPHKLTEWISGVSPDEAKNTDERFAALTTLRFPATGEHRMALGTVVREDDDKYWLCVTPACDCVRLKKEQHKLFFLRCRSAKDSDKIHFLIPPETDGAEHIPITVGFKIEDGHHWEFKPDPVKQMVLAEQSGGGRSSYFLTTENEKLHWVAELKPAHARRITHHFASEWSRVGVTEAEWLRRCSDL